MRVAVVGTGYWGRNHVRVWRELLDEGAIDDLVLFDIHRPTVERLSRDFGLPVAPDMDSIVHGDADAVDIITPTATHAEMGIEVMRAGKDLFVEKPMAQTAEEARRMVAVAEETGRILMPGHIFRYHGALNALHRMIRRGDLGEVLQIHTHRTTLRIPRTDMGVLLALGIHDVDICAHLLGEMPGTIYCETQENHVEGIEDTAFILLSFPGGTKAFIHESWTYPVGEKTRRLAVIGRRMSALIDYLRPTEIVIFDRRIDETDGMALRDEGHRAEMVTYAEPLAEELRDFVRAVRTREPPASDMRVGLLSVEMIEAAARSVGEGRPVTFSPSI